MTSDGFIFLGHRIIRKRGPRGRMRSVTTIPWENYRSFTDRLVKESVRQLQRKQNGPGGEPKPEVRGMANAAKGQARWSSSHPEQLK